MLGGRCHRSYSLSRQASSLKSLETGSDHQVEWVAAREVVNVAGGGLAGVRAEVEESEATKVAMVETQPCAKRLER